VLPVQIVANAAVVVLLVAEQRKLARLELLPSAKPDIFADKEPLAQQALVSRFTMAETFAIASVNERSPTSEIARTSIVVDN
jgi:hypothetical protein